MMMAAGAVDMAVGNFLFGCFAHGFNTDIEPEPLSSQRVVGIESHLFRAHLDNDKVDLPLGCIRNHGYPGFDFFHTLKRFMWHFMHTIFAALAIGIGGFNRYFDFITLLFTLERPLQSGNDVIGFGSAALV